MSARWAYNILDWLRRVWTFICSLTIFTSRSPGLPAHNLRSSAEKLEFVGNNYDDGSGTAFALHVRRGCNLFYS
ncbi:hypothetical protein FA15DRAFT_501118 [Coprinopsis marcescibilis]|uniref:Uncharacterized protein n=1 Tax=Coprinopsis marcescibilis TaxID=230819 RepID=A0A5C3KQP1_COPMA|nr:hypothetical protein FA15DRAFT_501118 [Coprinopsis marcescibilis]